MSILSKQFENANNIVVEVESIKKEKDQTNQPYQEYATPENRAILVDAYWNLTDQKYARREIAIRNFVFYGAISMVQEGLNVSEYWIDPKTMESWIFQLPVNFITIITCIGMYSATRAYINSKQYERASKRVKRTIKKLFPEII